MDNKTPIQASLAYWKKLQKDAITSELRASAGIFVQHLESLLPKEKQFAEYVWMQGVATGYESGKNGSSSKPTLPEFLNQLYPEK